MQICVQTGEGGVDERESRKNGGGREREKGNDGMQLRRRESVPRAVTTSGGEQGIRTNLTSVGVLSPHDPPRGNLHIRILQHHRGALPSELQRSRAKMLRRSPRHNPPDLARSRIKHMLVLEREELRRLRDAAEDAGERRRVEIAREEGGDERGGGGGELGGLEEAGAAGGDGAEEGAEEEGDGDCERLRHGTTDEAGVSACRVGEKGRKVENEGEKGNAQFQALSTATTPFGSL